jgi:hypothetical protein
VAPQPPPHDSPEPYSEALITIHGRVYRGLVRCCSWSEEHNCWQCSVEISVDDRRLMTSVSADQIQCIRSEEPDKD